MTVVRITCLNGRYFKPLEKKAKGDKVSTAATGVGATMRKGYTFLREDSRLPESNVLGIDH